MDYWRKISGDDEQENHVELKHYEQDPSKWYLNTRSKIFCSLASGLPNEIDFALRASTLLANSGQFDWIRDYRFIDLVLQIQAQYVCICDLECEEVDKIKKHQEELLGFCSENEPNFFQDKVISSPDEANIEPEDSELSNLISSNPNLKTAKAEILNPPECHCWHRYWLELLDDCDTDIMEFILGHDLTEGDSETICRTQGLHIPRLKERIDHRVKFIADLLHLLSFTCEEEGHLFSSTSDPCHLVDECCVPIGTSCALLRYIALLIHCDDIRLKNIGWDILANVASVTTRKCPLEMDEYRALQMIVFKKVISDLYNSTDSQTICRSMEVLSKIIINGSDDTLSIITRTLRQFSCPVQNHLGDLIELDLTTEPIPLPVRLSHLLTNQDDVYLVISTLEFCLCLSEQHPLTLIGQPIHLPHTEISNSLTKTNSTITEQFRPLMKLLMNFLSMDASKHFNESAFKSIRIIDDLNRVYAPVSRPAVTSVHQTGATLKSVTPVSTTQQMRVPTNQPADKSIIKIENQQQSETKAISYNNTISNQRLTSIPQIVQQTPSQSSTMVASTENNEQFANNWLNNTFIHQPSSLGSNKIRMKLSDIFTEYIRTNSTLGRKQVLTMSSFSELIRRIFPSAVIVDDHVEGIIQKGVNAIVRTTLQQPVSISPSKTSVIQTPKAVNDFSKVITVQTSQSASKPSTPPPSANGPTPSTGILSSPILKAQLSAPPKVSPPAQAKAASNEHQQNSTSPSATSPQTILIHQATSPNTSTSNGGPSTNLIKTLLATKIRANAVTTSAMSGTLNSYQDAPNQQITTTSMAQPNMVQVSAAPASAHSADQVRQVIQTPSLSQQHTIVIGSTSSAIHMNSLVTSKPNIPSQPSVVVNQNQSLVRALVGQPNQQVQQPQQQTIAIAQGGTSTPQQFFLVRVSNPSTGVNTTQQSNSPIRLIVPASALMNPQARPLLTSATQAVPHTNGLDKGVVTSQVCSIPQGNQILKHAVSVASSNDGTLKQMLGISGPQSQATTPLINGSGPVSETVKSSPLLNVLLDKGKLPEAPLCDAQSNHIQIGQVTNTSQQQQPKLLILSTKGPLPVNNAIHPNGPSRHQLYSISNGDIKQSGVQHTEQKTIIINTEQPKPLVNGSNAAKNHSDVQMAMESSGSNSEKRQISQPELAVKKIKSTTSPVLNQSNEKPKQIFIKAVSTAPNGPTVNTVVTASQAPVSNTQPVQQFIITQAGRIMASPHISKVSVPQVPRLQPQYTCEWNGCKRMFVATSEVFIHVFRDHLAHFTTDTVSQCLWTATEGVGPGCKMARPKLSLLTHILDFHCSDATLKAIAKRSTGLAGNIPPPPIPAQHPGYAQNAALLAIKRHSVNYHETPPPPPSGFTVPLTVSIRLTSALVLRNLAEKCPTLTSTLSCHESYLSVLSILEGREESRTLAQTLAVISEKSPLKRKLLTSV